MNTALALAGCEAPNIAAASGLEPKAEAGTGTAGCIAEGFKKKLEDCEAVIVPAQQVLTCGGTAETVTGIQANVSGTAEELPEIYCMIEGLGMPENPSDVTQTLTETAGTAPAVMPESGTATGVNAADGQQKGSTPEPIAWTQNTTAGDTPAKTQDEILKAVGAYMDAPPEAAPDKTAVPDKTGMPAQPAPAAQDQAPAEAAAPPQEMAGSTVTADAQPNARSDGQPEPNAAQDAAAWNTVKSGENAAVEKPDAAAAEKRPATAQTAAPDEPEKLQDTGAPVAEPRMAAPVSSETAKADPVETRSAEPQYTKENVLRIVDKVSTQSAEGRYEFDVELKPDFLGKVNIRLSMKDGDIRMQIKTDDMAVKGMLSDQTSALQSALKDKGITLTSVDVTYENQASLEGGRQPFEQNSGGRPGGTYYVQAETTGFEPAAEPYSYYVGNSSVEFLA